MSTALHKNNVLEFYQFDPQTNHIDHRREDRNKFGELRGDIGADR